MPLCIRTNFGALGGGEAHLLFFEVKNVDPAFAVMPQVALAEPEEEASSGVIEILCAHQVTWTLFLHPDIF